MRDFFISDTDLLPRELEKGLNHTQAGGYCSFEGWVRDHNDNRLVKGLEYEVYRELATSEGLKIIAEAKEKFKISAARAVHREGKLGIGGLAVWIGVSAPHRGAAFDACRYIIDEIKARLPIWKRELYKDGAIEWVACSCHHPHKQ